MIRQQEIQQIEIASLLESLRFFSQLFPGRSVFTTSLGQEDQVITDVIFRHDLPIEVVTLDTGRLFSETYELIERTEARYKKKIKVFFPDASEVEEYVSTRGINGFYESVEFRKQCCEIRKVRPLNRALANASLWITGLRAEQSANRQQMETIEWLKEKGLYKLNPILHWNYDAIISYINEFNVPYNNLHHKGFISIGCAPCTRAIEPGEDPRAGRWWWEESHKECGLHK